MSNWSDLLNEFAKQNLRTKSVWLNNRLDEQLTNIANRRGTNVIAYPRTFT